MRSRSLIVLGAIVAVVITTVGCWRHDLGSSRGDRLSFHSPLAPHGPAQARDSIPPQPPPPSPPSPSKPGISAQFAGADSVSAGQTSITRWLLGNQGRARVTVQWTLTDEHGWPGFPKQGSADLEPLSTQRLDVAVLVPDTAAAGTYPLHLGVTARDRLAASADGAIRVGSPPDSL